MSNEEQMRAEFETWCDTNIFPQSWKDDKGAWEMWKVKQREIDALKAELAKHKGLAEMHLETAGESIQSEAALTQQALELSAQVEVMREALLSFDGSFAVDQWDETFPPSRKWNEKRKIAVLTEPSAALTHHDNEVAAKALEEAAGMAATCVRGSTACNEITAMANERRNGK